MGILQERLSDKPIVKDEEKPSAIVFKESDLPTEVSESVDEVPSIEKEGVAEEPVVEKVVKKRGGRPRKQVSKKK